MPCELEIVGEGTSVLRPDGATDQGHRNGVNGEPIARVETLFALCLPVH